MMLQAATHLTRAETVASFPKPEPDCRKPAYKQSNKAR